METTYLKINPADNVAVAITPLKAGETIQIDGQEITLKTDIPAGHKVTLQDFNEGDNIVKYGYPIGHAIKHVPQGSWICEKEIKTNLAGLLDYTYNPVEVSLDIPQENLTYLGNLPGEDLSLPPDELHTESYVDTTVGWDGSKYNRWFEKRVLDKYLSWLGK